jgi:hypothetical protein
MHFCTAAVAIGGDTRNTMIRGEFSPVSWPEIEILRIVHGDQSITDVSPFVRVPQSPREERARLADIYGEPPLAVAWGGRSAPGEVEAPGVDLKAGVAWFNPLTHRVEITADGGSVKAPDPEPVVAQPAEAVLETFGDMTRPPPSPIDADDEDDAPRPARRR